MAALVGVVLAPSGWIDPFSRVVWENIHAGFVPAFLADKPDSL
jgi:hypothetical protein